MDTGLFITHACRYVRLMAAQLIDGKKIAAELRSQVAKAVSHIKQSYNYQPCLAVILVGEDPASQVYVRSKHKFTRAAGMRSLEYKLPQNASEDEILAVINRLNNDENVDGILVQLPLPKSINTERIIAAIDPAKDVDGLTVTNAGRLSLGRAGLRPCTPEGCVILAKSALGEGETLSGKNCVIIGRSILVGKPAAFLFLHENCTVTIAHSRTKDLANLCRSADILVAAIGRPEMIKGDFVKQGAIVIDVGINRIVDKSKKSGYRLVGDVEFEGAAKKAGAITPVPGGVGPMTIACLLRNTILAACARGGLDLQKPI